MTDADPDRPASSPPHGRSIPLPVAIVTLVSIFVWGVVLIARYHYRPAPAPPPIRTTVPPPDNPKVAGGAPPSADARTRTNVLRAAAEADLPDGLRTDPSGGTLVKAGDAYLKVADNNGDTRANFGFFTLSDREWEHGYLTQGVRRLTSDEEYARELGLAPDQLKRLQDLPQSPPSRWPDADRDRFLALYQNWRAASDKDKPQAATRLLEALKTYATERRTANHRLMQQRVTAIRAILNEQQLTRINPIPRWNLPTPAPTTQPADRR